MKKPPPQRSLLSSQDLPVLGGKDVVVRVSKMGRQGQREGERQRGRIEGFGWLGLREPGAVFQDKKKKKKAEFSFGFFFFKFCSCGVQPATWVRWVWRDEPDPGWRRKGRHLHLWKKEPCAFSLGYTFPAEPYDVSPLLMLTQAEPAHSDSIHRLSAPKFREGKRIISSGSKLECLQAINWRMNSWEFMCTSLETIWKTEQTCSSSCSVFLFIYSTKSSLKFILQMFWLAAWIHIKDRCRSNLCQVMQNHKNWHWLELIISVIE